MNIPQGTTRITNGRLPENRKKFIAAMRRGIIKAGQLAEPFFTAVKSEK